MLKPGGRIYFDNVSTDLGQRLASVRRLVRYDPAARPPNISKASNPEELRTYAIRAGFTDTKSARPRSSSPSPPPSPGVIGQCQAAGEALAGAVVSSWPAPVSLWVFRLNGCTTAAPSLAVGAVRVTRPRRKRSSRNAVTAFVGLGATTEIGRRGGGDGEALLRRSGPARPACGCRGRSGGRRPTFSATVTAESAASRLAAAFLAGIVAISVFMLSVASSDSTPCRTNAALSGSRYFPWKRA